MKIKYLILLLSIIFGFVCCKTEELPVVEDGYVAPEVTSTVNQNNLITFEFYSHLNEEPLFQSKDYQSVIDHLVSNKTPMAFIFDRSDAILGETSPVVDIAWQSKLKSFFVQNQVENTQVQGTGMIVRSLVTVFDGIGIADSLYLSGCTLAAPLSQPIVLTLMTCKLTENFQFPIMSRSLGDGLKTNKIVIGTIKGSLENDFKTYLKYHLKDFRLSFFTSGKANSSYKLFYLTPVEFINRETTELTIGDVPMYQCKIEYLN